MRRLHSHHSLGSDNPYKQLNTATNFCLITYFICASVFSKISGLGGVGYSLITPWLIDGTSSIPCLSDDLRHPQRIRQWWCR